MTDKYLGWIKWRFLRLSNIWKEPLPRSRHTQVCISCSNQSNRLRGPLLWGPKDTSNSTCQNQIQYLFTQTCFSSSAIHRWLFPLPLELCKSETSAFPDLSLSLVCFSLSTLCISSRQPGPNPKRQHYLPRLLIVASQPQRPIHGAHL